MIVDVLNGKAAYYHAPKCGSRTILGWIAILESPNIFAENPHWFKETSPGDPVYNEIRKRVKILSTGFEDFSHYPVRFCIIRDPVDRFLSAYINRIVFHKDLIKLKNNPPSILEFIENFDYFCKNNESTRIHFLPQKNFYGENLNLYTHIFRFKEFREVKNLLEKIKGETLPDIRLQQSGSLQKPTIGQFETNWIKKLYSIDYEIYKDYIN